ncbi:MAG: universal stress protein, partial [Anaerolineales bacterium]|nr:universal stress protein [Anaerolineales bacterium]
CSSSASPPDLKTADADDEVLPLFGRILVPVADLKQSAGLVSLASLLAHSSKGRVLAVSVASDTGMDRDSNFSLHKELLGRVPELLNDPGTEIELIPRLASSHAQGILQTAHEQNASLILMGWRGKRTLRVCAWQCSG